MLAAYLVRYCSTFQGNIHHVGDSRLLSFRDRGGNFAGLAKLKTDASATVPNHDERAEAKASSTLRGLGRAFGENDSDFRCRAPGLAGKGIGHTNRSGE
jgi:hypothetical protein